MQEPKNCRPQNNLLHFKMMNISVFFLSIYTQIHSLKYKSYYIQCFFLIILGWENAFKQNGFFHCSPQFVLMHLLWKRRASADTDCCVKWENDQDVDANI